MIDREDLIYIYKRCWPVLDFYRGKKVFITGGTGFFGKWFLEAFIYLNHEENLNCDITVLSRNPKIFKEKFPHLTKGINFVEGDIESFSNQGEDFDYLIHAATEASASLNLNDPSYMFNSIVDGMRNVIKFANESKVQRILHTSSGAVYGKQPWALERIDETFIGAPDPMCMKSSYGEGKRAAELLGMINSASNRVDFINARCFAFAGPYLNLNGTFAIGNFIRDALLGKDIEILGDGTAVRSYLYSADLIAWLLTLLAKGKNGDCYNIGSENYYSIKQLADEVASQFDGVQVIVRGTSDPLMKASRYVPSVKKIKDDFGLNESLNLEGIIKKMINFYKDDSLI